MIQELTELTKTNGIYPMSSVKQTFRRR